MLQDTNTKIKRPCRTSSKDEKARHQYVMSNYQKLYNRPWVPPNNELTCLNFGNQLSEFSGIRAERSTSIEHQDNGESKLDQWNSNYENMIKLATRACDSTFKTKTKGRVGADYPARRKAFAGLLLLLQEVFTAAHKPYRYHPRIWINGPKYVQMCETVTDTLDWCYTNKLGILCIN